MDKRVLWMSNMQVGYAPLDEEHKSFIDIINQSYIFLARQDVLGFERVFEWIDEYIQSHFPHEEKILIEIQFPDSLSHQESHHRFKENIEELKTLFFNAEDMKTKEKLAFKTADYIKAWFLGHILSRDKIYKPYLVRLNQK